MTVILSISFSCMWEMSEYEQKQSQSIKENELELLKTGFVSTQTADFSDISSTTAWG